MVYRGIWRQTVVAIKAVRIDLDEKVRKEVELECAVMARVGIHPNVVHFIGATTHNNALYIVTEFAQHGSLYDYAIARNTPLDDDALHSIIHDAAAGLAHLHSENVVHQTFQRLPLHLFE